MQVLQAAARGSSKMGVGRTHLSEISHPQLALSLKCTSGNWATNDASRNRACMRIYPSHNEDLWPAVLMMRVRKPLNTLPGRVAE